MASDHDVEVEVEEEDNESTESIIETFTYTMWLGREMREDKYIRSVTFNISRYGKYTKTLTFPELFSEQEAIHTVEAWLSKPFDRAYWDGVQDDLFCSMRKYKVCRNKCRGFLLSDCRYLEIISPDELRDDHVYFICGS